MTTITSAGALRAWLAATLAVCTVALAASAGLGWQAASAAEEPVRLTFDKASVSASVWTGRVDGDVDGELTTVLISADTSSAVWSVDFYWIVTADDPRLSFVARLAGTLDTDTGAVAMRGRVVDGYRVGALVEESGQLYDGERSAFRGTIDIQGS